MSITHQVSPARVERTLTSMVAAQRMAGAEPTEADVDIARRQASGEITADEAVALALAAARTPVTAD